MKKSTPVNGGEALERYLILILELSGLLCWEISAGRSKFLKVL